MRPWPFNLAGPHFLGFFAAFGLCVVLIPLYLRRASSTRDDPPLPHLTDPTEIATLRGGFQEAARLALIVLTERGLLEQKGKTFHALPGGADSIRDPLELAVFDYFRRGLPPDKLLSDEGVQSVGRKLQSSLESRGLWVPAAQRNQIFRRSLAALGAVAGLRMLMSGPPFGFLLIECAAFLVLANWVRVQPLNARGVRLLSQLRELFLRLKLRARRIERGTGQEVALLAAVFGLGALPFPVRATLRLVKPKPDSSGGSCGAGSSCGGGSGCGGGCGGGCGS
jgi:uncharacterized protein (TIGR04222 family)